MLAFSLAGCGATSSAATATVEGGPTDAAVAIDPCDLDAFSGAGNACPFVTPIRCFAQCEAGGCFCQGTDSGPRWACTTDRSCLPACAPIDLEQDGCAEPASD
jgi:hypothetical protein